MSVVISWWESAKVDKAATESAAGSGAADVEVKTSDEIILWRPCWTLLSANSTEMAQDKLEKIDSTPNEKRSQHSLEDFAGFHSVCLQLASNFPQEPLWVDNAQRGVLRAFIGEQSPVIS